MTGHLTYEADAIGTEYSRPIGSYKIGTIFIVLSGVSKRIGCYAILIAGSPNIT